MYLTIAIALVISGVSFIAGYIFGKSKLLMADRCECLIGLQTSFEGADKKDKTVRCELFYAHCGPHRYTVPSKYNNGGDEIWWKSDGERSLPQ